MSVAKDQPLIFHVNRVVIILQVQLGSKEKAKTQVAQVAEQDKGGI